MLACDDILGVDANSDAAAVRTAVANYIEMPPEVIASMKLGRWQAAVTENGIADWVNIMKRQDCCAAPMAAPSAIASWKALTAARPILCLLSRCAR